MLNDQAAGLAAKVVRGTPRDSLHFVDVVAMQQGGKVPEAIITDTGVGALGLGGHSIDVLGVTGVGR